MISLKSSTSVSRVSDRTGTNVNRASLLEDGKSVVSDLSDTVLLPRSFISRNYPGCSVTRRMFINKDIQHLHGEQ